MLSSMSTMSSVIISKTKSGPPLPSLKSANAYIMAGPINSLWNNNYSSTTPKTTSSGLTWTADVSNHYFITVTGQTYRNGIYITSSDPSSCYSNQNWPNCFSAYDGNITSGLVFFEAYGYQVYGTSVTSPQTYSTPSLYSSYSVTTTDTASSSLST